MHEKLDDLRTTDRSWKQSEVEVPPGHARHRRQRLPVKVILQHRRLSAWRPGTAAVRALAQSIVFIDESGLSERPHRWTLAAPAQLPQNAPGLRGMVAGSAFLLD